MKTILITGGAGFIGINTAAYFLKKGNKVIIYDNFSRKGSKSNILWLKANTKSPVEVIKGDIKKPNKILTGAIAKADVVIHLAAQVAVTTSVKNPREDFEINAMGTFNVLEAARASKKNPIVLYSSTNKVYGNLSGIKIKEAKTRYSMPAFPHGISESTNLDFYSPYGCSKGIGDQYVHDYHRVYGMKTIVFRQSCIYGPHQFGIEDQGWVAWFLIALLQNKKITIFGNGKQVRDILFIDDLIRAYDLAIENIEKTKGKIYNIGGGPKNAISVWYEFQPILEKLLGKKIIPKFSPFRTGDQKIFIADIRSAKKDFGWQPKIGVQEGIKKLYLWIQENKNLFKNI